MPASNHFRLLDGLEQSYREMTKQIEASAPTCHLKKMWLEENDSTEGYTEQWWECSVCGHTKPLH